LPARPRRRLGVWIRRWLLEARLWVDDEGPVVRRAIDIAVASVGILFTAPLLLVVAIGIKLESLGPVVFAQERIGKHGKPFRLYKLRTMVPGADALKTDLSTRISTAVDGVRFKLRRDPRVTAFGRWLRKFSIDELPQLWNVLKGDMTLIGPRPLVLREVALFDGRALRRLEVQPGLTCIWQVSGRSDLPFQKQIDLDIEYVDRCSVARELAIVARTIPAVLSGKGAY
jgi:lipopolysaccharide/colanic/teichoic acid biosynthesis glycosyltransferase